MTRFVPPGFGWRQDLPDFRDWTPYSADVQDLLQSLKPRRKRGSRQRPARVDLREFFSPASDQGKLDASSAHACCALVEYFERRAFGQDVRLSARFLYFTSRRMAMLNGNSGVDLRSALKAVARCGIPAERYWPYVIEQFEEIPDAFLYSFTDRLRDLCYLRLDARNHSGGKALDLVRAFLAAGFPMVFGFAAPTSMTSAAEIPYRPTFDSVWGGQSLVAVGYDDAWLSGSRGALLVRNSWGTSWGEHGYGWLPYAFVEERLARDFWTLLQPDWLASGEFSRPLIIS